MLLDRSSVEDRTLFPLSFFNCNFSSAGIKLEILYRNMGDIFLRLFSLSVRSTELCGVLGFSDVRDVLIFIVQIGQKVGL